MEVLWVILVIVYQFRSANSWWFTNYNFPWHEKYHYPGHFTSTMSPYVNGTETKIASTWDTPDYRIEEPLFTIKYPSWPHEIDRPYRNSPPYKQSRSLGLYESGLDLSMGCYCCTTYRRHILLAGCAVITSRHALTTATSTSLILRSYPHMKSLENILGGWYDVNANVYNASMYFTPSRIHIHPMYRYDYEVNASHPIPAMYDLAVWTATYTFYGGTFWYNNAIICNRGTSGWFEYTSTIPRKGDSVMVAGFQFIKSYKRRPMPWFRYVVRTEYFVWPCPKSDWHWFHCLMNEYWGKYGFDSGGGLTAKFGGRGWRRDGMIGLCAFSLKLRAMRTVHYFTVVDTWPVLDFLYDSFLGLKPPVYLDYRFEDTKWRSPMPYWGEYVHYSYYFGQDYYYQCGWVPKY